MLWNIRPRTVPLCTFRSVPSYLVMADSCNRLYKKRHAERFVILRFRCKVSIIELVFRYGFSHY